MMRFFEAAGRGDVGVMRELAAADVTVTWPQSGERFSGVDNALAAMEAQDEPPIPVGDPRILGSGDLWVVQMPLRYGEELRHYVGIFELRGGRIGASTEYFADPFPPKASRAPFADDGR